MREHSLVLKCLLAGLVLVMGSALPAVAEIDSVWTGAGSDNLWSNPDNWLDGWLPGTVDPEDELVGDAIVDGPAGASPNGPLIEDGVYATTDTLYTEAGDVHMTMTGGDLELTGWGSWWGDGTDNHSVFDLSGGTVRYLGSPGILEMAWMSGSEPPGHSVSGLYNMTGGRVFAKGISVPAVQSPPSEPDRYAGTFDMVGGRLNVGTARGGLILKGNGLVDLKGGTMVLEAEFDTDDTIFVVLDIYGPNHDILDGEVQAYGGAGTVNAVAGLPGDYDADNDADGNDLLDWQLNDGSAAGLTDWHDSLGLSSEIGFVTVTGTPAAVQSVPEPASATLAILYLCCVYGCGRRRHS